MPLWRYLQPWLTGHGPCLQVADVVPDTPPLRQWARDVAVGGFGRSRSPRVRPARPPTTHHAWTAARLEAGLGGGWSC